MTAEIVERVRRSARYRDVDAALLDDAMRVARRLRDRGRSVEYALGGQQLSRQLKAADAAGLRGLGVRLAQAHGFELLPLEKALKP